jgi:aminomethyltransferase
MKNTPLYENHRKLGGKIIDFGGWALPVQYEGIIKEHRQVREAAGLFDVSHMGEITVRGKDAAKFIQNLVTNNIGAAVDGQIVYSPMCYPDGGVVDDLLVYRIGAEDYLLIVNAANTDKDFDWMLDNMSGDVLLRNVSDEYAQLAVQGPKAEAVLQKLADVPLSEIKFYHFNGKAKIAGASAIVSRTGYTGEDGFEIYIAAGEAPRVWEELLAAGNEDGLVPVGLGARDTLRFEVALPLYGNEITKDITPLEAGLGMFVKLDKGNFIGRDALLKQKEEGIKRKLVGFEMIEPGVPRSHYEVFASGKSIGFVTSGSFSPSLQKNLGLALVDAAYSAAGTEVDIVIRGRETRARVAAKPFYSKKYKK